MAVSPSGTADDALLRELLGAAERLGVDVRVEPFEPPALGAGGLCSVRGAKLVLLDRHASVRDRAWTLAGALATLDIDGVYVAPLARELIERLQDRRGAGDAGPVRGSGPMSDS